MNNLHSPSTECWRFVSVPLVRRRRREGVRDNDRAQIFAWGNTTHFRSGAVGATPLVPPEMCGRASSDPCGVAAEHRTAAAILPTSSAIAYVASSVPANQPSWGCKPACKNVPEKHDGSLPAVRRGETSKYRVCKAAEHHSSRSVPPRIVAHRWR